jgi:arylsulfatase A-like enzyme
LLRGLYEAEIAYLDRQIGWLTGHLKGKGVLDNTVVIVTSDHGENIGEHDRLGHQFSVHDNLLRVPLVIRYPQKVPSGKRDDFLAQNVDILPTVLDLCDIPERPDLKNQCQGVSLLRDKQRHFTFSELNAIGGGFGFQRRFPEECAMQGLDNNLTALRTNEWKYILGSNGSSTLYDLKHDAEELTDVREHHPDVVETLSKELDNWLRSHNVIHKTDSDAPTADMDPDTLHHLQGLGYL